ncbi:MAG: hypothetical protein QNJ40_02570 [Xanthomonadales bacterium]|nr:hypothetical protein [Xanthomonadales bacterium]
MRRLLMPGVVLLLTLGVHHAPLAQEVRDGKLQQQADGSWRAWHADSGAWVTPVEFWERYAESRGGLTWGKRSDYPPYAQVKELDKMIIQLDSGPCLMEFFHRRWRRAQDVRRWDPQFNQLLGCPNVFD